ncbi:UTP--glucose-1-phosphate uridylyltransferase GalU [Candidiatus Paracoxiella cheracis]|uniref:UTP--glucose-1-phosphate uridylyltransferase GalU n=1 Tax=Candidiatus Paracoxiella cheracis TaxID=3405120 RepID=UPI003BF50265
MGTRFLPVTKAQPKEMLPIVDKPVIQYVVEEAIAAGITHLVFVTSSGKRAIEDYFDTNFELETRLKERGKIQALASVQNLLPGNVRCTYVRQANPLGLGDAVLSARHVVGDQPFAVLLADDVIDCGEKSCIQLMVDIFNRTQSSIVAVETIPIEQSDKYGIVSLDKHDADVSRVNAIVEKPTPAQAPSNLAVTGRYILTPRIFDLLEHTERGVGGEVQLTDAISALLKEEQIFAYPFQGRRYDCGNQMGLLEATIAYALKRPDLNGRLRQYLEQLSANALV